MDRPETYQRAYSSFLDADLIGLKPVHIENLVAPVVKDMADMTVGIFYSGRNITDLAQKLMPFLSGQRCVKREILDKLDSKEWFSEFWHRSCSYQIR